MSKDMHTRCSHKKDKVSDVFRRGIYRVKVIYILPITIRKIKSAICFAEESVAMKAYIPPTAMRKLRSAIYFIEEHISLK